MNPSNLIARHTRAVDPAEEPSIEHHQLDRNLEISVPPATAEHDPHPPAGESKHAEEILHLRHALAQVLSRDTGQDIQFFQSPVVDNARLCAIADNIWNHRHWSA